MENRSPTEFAHGSFQKINPIVALTSIGLLSGLLTAVLMAENFFNNSVIYNILPGVIFGAALSAYLIIFKQEKTWYKIIGFIAVSCVAYLLAVSATISTHFHINPFPLKDPIDPTLFFSGGIVGAAILSVGFKFLLSPIKYWQVLTLTVLGGLLGMLGWIVGSWLYPTVPTDSWGVTLPKANMYSLFILWQTGMAVAVAIYLKLNVRSVILPIPEKENIAPSKSYNGLISKIVAAIGVAAFVLLVLGPIVERAYVSHQQAIVAKQYGSMPQTNPAITKIFSPDEMLLDYRIGDYTPGLAHSDFDDPSSSPHYHQYDVAYLKGDNKGVDLAVTVT